MKSQAEPSWENEFRSKCQGGFLEAFCFQISMHIQTIFNISSPLVFLCGMGVEGLPRGGRQIVWVQLLSYDGILMTLNLSHTEDVPRA